MEALPAFTLEDYYEIPDGSLEDWIKINPKVQEEVALEAQNAPSLFDDLNVDSGHLRLPFLLLVS